VAGKAAIYKMRWGSLSTTPSSSSSSFSPDVTTLSDSFGTQLKNHIIRSTQRERERERGPHSLQTPQQFTFVLNRLSFLYQIAPVGRFSGRLSYLITHLQHLTMHTHFFAWCYSRCMLLSCRIGEPWSMPNGSSKLETFMVLFR
jgi:hypothetical protein